MNSGPGSHELDGQLLTEMNAERVDYDQLAPTYNQRFASDRPSGVAQALLDFISQHQPTSILEAGCGTGHWLTQLAPITTGCLGLDLSLGMLRQAQQRTQAPVLLQGDAGHLPFPAGAFDLAFCVNAIHHFGEPQRFVFEAYRVLRPGGWLAIVGSDPHGQHERWFGYRYFQGAYQKDLARFPGEKRISNWLATAGFKGFNRQAVEHIRENRTGRAVFDDPYLQKQSCSQLALLSEAEYTTGLAKIERAIARAERRNEQIEFRTEITIHIWSGRKD